jgi:hypothetical protein
MTALVYRFQTWIALLGVTASLYCMKFMQLGHVILHGISNFLGFGCPLG